jgi:hypothetical protein
MIQALAFWDSQISSLYLELGSATTVEAV